MGSIPALGQLGHGVKRPWPFAEVDQRPTVSSMPTTEASLASEMIRHEEILCFGSIVDVAAQLGSRVRIDANQSLQSFAVVPEGTFFSLETDNVKFARLKKGLCGVLHSIVEEKPQLRLRAFVRTRELQAADRSWSPNSAPPTFVAEINLYGSESDADAIGAALSKAAIYIQFPQHGLSGTRYYNPHILHIKGHDSHSFGSGGSHSSVTDASLEPHPHVTDREGRAIDEANPVNHAAVVDSILDSLTHDVQVAEIPVDHRIKQKLLPHQVQAIDFIRQREMDMLPSDLSLWAYNDLDSDEPFYQHVFSGAKRPEKQEAKSGILADEMGLGKSLVILSTIAGSLDRAIQWSQLNSQNGPAKIASRATLILAPSSLLIDSWVDEIRTHTYPGVLSFHRHIGQARHGETHLLYDRDIVFTTYATVATEFARGESSLCAINWFRIVLDEAHDIRNRLTKQFQAVNALAAQHRWCLTGTPIQNSMDDLGALATFLKVPVLENAAAFRNFITRPIQSNSGGRFKNLRTLLSSICLRRTKEILNLPEPIPKNRRLVFSPLEHAEYNELLQNCRVEIDRAVSGHRKKSINSSVLESLLKLRLYCNNGGVTALLEAAPSGLPADPDEALALLQQYDRNFCAYCHGTVLSIDSSRDTDEGILLTSCSHLVCRNCLPTHRVQKDKCPLCANGTEDSIAPILTSSNVPYSSESAVCSNSVGQARQYPSKLLALLSDIQINYHNKSLVFSCWKKTLKIVAEMLRLQNIPFEMIDGSLSLKERLKVLKNFRSPTGANILLMTLGTGAVGLNLAVASRIYLLEPQWNPSIEFQAIGRALRLGQAGQVVIVRYIMMHTVEESNVLSRQRTKIQLAGGGFNSSKGMSKVIRDSLQDVFGVSLTPEGLDGRPESSLGID